MNTSVLCIDIGTTSLKAALINQEGKVLGLSRKKFLLRHTLHASKEWLPALQNAVKEIFEKNEYLYADALCISGNGPTLVSSTGDTLLWNEQVPAALEYSGTSLFIPRLLAFKNRFSEIWNKSETVFSGPEYLIWLLTDKKCTILPEERFYQAYWTDETLSQAGFTQEDKAKIPPFLKTTQKAGTLTRKAESFLGFEKNGLKEGLEVYCGAPDFISALAGTATVFPGKLCDRAGSSEGINLCTEKPITGKNIRTLPSVIPGLWNASILLPESGVQYSLFKKKIERENGGRISYEDLTKLCIEQNTDESLAQGRLLMEETALYVKDAIAQLKASWQEAECSFSFPKEMVITGGQSYNPLWSQMKANVTGTTIFTPECGDAELCGNAVFAFTGMKIFTSIQEGAVKVFRTAQTFIPE